MPSAVAPARRCDDAAGGTTAPGQTTVAGGTACTGRDDADDRCDARRPRTGATVVVANASSTGQMAGPMTDQLAELGYTMGEPTSQIEGPDEPRGIDRLLQRRQQLRGGRPHVGATTWVD